MHPVIIAGEEDKTGEVATDVDTVAEATDVAVTGVTGAISARARNEPRFDPKALARRSGNHKGNPEAMPTTGRRRTFDALAVTTTEGGNHG